MAALTTAIIGAAIIGAGATAYSVSQQKSAARKQERRLAAQEAEAKRIARNEASINNREDGGADVKLGREDATVTETGTGAGSGGASDRTGAVSSRIGGLGKKKKLSAGIGL
jgi:uncharacterized protein HemX